MFLMKPKHMSVEMKILAALKKAGRFGLWNYEISSPGIGGMGYRSRITDLRHDGHHIQCIRIKGSMWKYYLIQEDEQ